MRRGYAPAAASSRLSPSTQLSTAGTARSNATAAPARIEKLLADLGQPLNDPNDVAGGQP
jgi:hypothetical protein